MREHRPAGLRVRLEQREIDDPRERVRRLGSWRDPPNHFLSDPVEHGRGDPIWTDGDERGVAIVHSQLAERLDGEVLADRARDLFALTLDPREPGPAELLRSRDEEVDVFAGQR